MAESITVTAQKWAHGWELIIDDDNATQVRHLGHAGRQVRDYLDTVAPDIDHSHLVVDLVSADPAVRLMIDDARQARRQAEESSAHAAALSRSAVSALRHEQGLSLTDAAALLGVTRGRVAQLDRGRPADQG